jgi:hypothetical protein
MKRLCLLGAAGLLLAGAAGCGTMQEFCAKFRPGCGQEVCYDPCCDPCGSACCDRCTDGCGGCGDGCGAGNGGCDPYISAPGTYQPGPLQTSPGIVPGPETYTPSL